MKVCVVAEFYPRRREPVRGVWAHRQALAARDAGAEVKVIALERPVPPAATVAALRRGDPAPLLASLRELAAQPRHEVRDGLEIEYVRYLSPPRPRSYGRWHAWARAPLRRALTRLDAGWGIDLVHAHYALPAGAAASAFARERRLPLVVSVHGGDVFLAGAPVRALVADVLRGADAVLCNSQATRARCEALTGTAAGLEVVHLGAAAPAAAPPAGAAGNGVPSIATVGDVVERKRHADVLRALRLLEGPLEQLRYRVIGAGPELGSLRRLADELGVAGRVEWLGQLEPDPALSELARSSLMAMPSVDEAFGVAYVEALACGLPAIGCRGEGGPEEIAALSEAMVLVPPGDVAALAQAIESVLSDPQRLRDLSRAARDCAGEHFTWELCGRRTVAAYRRVLEARR